MSMTYENMKIQSLPAGMIIKNDIDGIPPYSYEDYLREYVNQSTFFLAKSDYIPYTKPQQESNGECDCISPAYQMDFKLAASKTLLQSKSLFSTYIQVENGWRSYGLKASPEDEGYKAIQATRLYVALRKETKESLEAISHSKAKQIGIENDIRHFLKNLQTDKNLLLFFPYNLFFDCNEDFDLGLQLAIQGINQDFEQSLLYRHGIRSKRDSYLAFLYSYHFVITEWKHSKFDLVDMIPVEKSPFFMTLLNYVDEFDNGVLK